MVTKDSQPMKNKWLIVFLAGLLILVVSIPVSEPEEKMKTPKKTKEETFEEQNYADTAEKKLEEAIGTMEGVGKVKVIVTLASSSEKVVEKDTERSEQKTEQTTRETTVYEENSEREQIPYVSKEISPAIEGVVVIAEGGDKPVVVQNITEAVQALFSVESHKIKVVKMK